MVQARCGTSSLSGREVTGTAVFGNRATDLGNCDGIVRPDDC